MIEGMSDLKRALDDLEKDVQVGSGSKITKCLQSLWQMGYHIASAGFRNAIYNGTNDVVVDANYHWEGNTLSLVAHGETVMFIEFGTGLVYEAGSHPWAGMWPGTSPGSWSFGPGSRQLEGKNWWIYSGEQGNGDAVHPKSKKTGRESKGWKTRGNPPARAMYEAEKEMRLNIEFELARWFK